MEMWKYEFVVCHLCFEPCLCVPLPSSDVTIVCLLCHQITDERCSKSLCCTACIYIFLMKSAVFWVITWRCVVIVYWHFGTTYRSHPHGSRVWIGIGPDETWHSRSSSIMHLFEWSCEQNYSVSTPRMISSTCYCPFLISVVFIALCLLYICWYCY
jgi:hypothetical protein